MPPRSWICLVVVTPFALLSPIADIHPGGLTIQGLLVAMTCKQCMAGRHEDAPDMCGDDLMSVNS